MGPFVLVIIPLIAVFMANVVDPHEEFQTNERLFDFEDLVEEDFNDIPSVENADSFAEIRQRVLKKLRTIASKHARLDQLQMELADLSGATLSPPTKANMQLIRESRQTLNRQGRFYARQLFRARLHELATSIKDRLVPDPVRSEADFDEEAVSLKTELDQIRLGLEKNMNLLESDKQSILIETCTLQEAIEEFQRAALSRKLVHEVEEIQLLDLDPPESFITNDLSDTLNNMQVQHETYSGEMEDELRRLKSEFDIDNEFPID